jgi:hypothetical protein
MCQCGCGEVPIERAFELTSRCVLGVKIYTGCAECFPGLAVDLSVFNSAKVEWLEHAEIDRTVKPNEYGGTNDAIGIPVPIIDVSSLREQARAMEVDLLEMQEYASFDDWLMDYGFELLQGAARKFLEKQGAK